ncbi:MAG: DUF4007 family protein [Candidatus Schekmanbacteria bacterium]|nr:DUF4007 family protein [Candidatus Schekmanbacteria bacterium]
MRFAGHETFPIRTGWLSKGLRLLGRAGGGAFDRPDLADELGVGRNMAKSIRFWLDVLGLAGRRGKGDPLEPTPLGKLVCDRDPYFQHTATWWVLHVNLVTHRDVAVAWRWFFNDFAPERFDRLTCSEELVAALERQGQRLPSRETVAREVACLLQSYATPVPAEQEDPEDAADCPLRQLGLLSCHRDTGAYDRRFAARWVPPELLGYVLARRSGAGHGGTVELPFADSLVAAEGPGRVLGLNAEGLAALVSRAAEALGPEQVRFFLLGGERMIAVANRSPGAWLASYYDRVGV